MAIYPPDRIHVADGKAEHSVALIAAHGCGNLLSEEEAKSKSVMKANRFQVGGYGRWVETNVNPRQYWTPKERADFREFMRLRRKWIEEIIPVERQALFDKLMRFFGTTDPQVMESKMNKAIEENDRLNILTRRGIIKTTVDDQAEFAEALRSAEETRGKG